MRTWLLLLLLAFNAVAADRKPEVEAVVRKYLTTYQEQRWDALGELLHPEWFQAMRDLVLKTFPKTDADVSAAKRKEVDELLRAYGATNVAAVWNIPPKDFSLRMLRQNSLSPTMQKMKEIKTTIQSVSIEERGQKATADVAMISEFRDTKRNGTAHFELVLEDGKWLIFGMSKSR